MSEDVMWSWSGRTVHLCSPIKHRDGTQSMCGNVKHGRGRVSVSKRDPDDPKNRCTVCWTIAKQEETA